MANPLRNAMVYLGLAEEEPRYFDEHDEVDEPAPVPRRHAAQVTPLRRTTPDPGRTAPHAAPAPIMAGEMNEILTVHPRQYKDAQVIAEQFRNGIPVIINLSQMSESDARRLIDFASGLSQGLYGKIERVTAKVFLLSPAHIVVSGEPGSADGDIDASF